MTSPEKAAPKADKHVAAATALVLGAAILSGCGADSAEIGIFPPSVRINPTYHYYFDMECTPKDPLQVMDASFGKQAPKRLVVGCVQTDPKTPSPRVDRFEGDKDLSIVDDPTLDPSVIDIAYVGPKDALDDFVIDETGQYVTFFLDGIAQLKSVHINYYPLRTMYT